MRAVVQRVSEASVVVENRIVAQIAPGGTGGLAALVGFVPGDGPRETAWLAEKLVHLRIFPDEQGKMNLSVAQTGGGVLLIPNFTLAGDANKGRRPSFDGAMRPEQAEPLFATLVEMVRGLHPHEASGVFRASMRVSLVNEGPVTLILDSRQAGAPAI